MRDDMNGLGKNREPQDSASSIQGVSHKKSYFWHSLIAIAVIVFFFATLLFPALHRAKASAQRAQCLSHLKQIGLALKQYAFDNKETLAWEKNTTLYCSAFGKVTPSYSKDLEIFTCPSSNDRPIQNRKESIDNEPFSESECRQSLSYAYGHDRGKPWTESAPSSTRIAADKYALQDYTIKNYPRKRRSNHNTTWFGKRDENQPRMKGMMGRHAVHLDGSAKWDNRRGKLEADPEWDMKAGMSVENPEYKRLDDSNPESDQTGSDWWSDPPEKP